MSFKVRYHIWEPGKQAPTITTENRALAYIEFGTLKNKMPMARMTYEVIPENLTGPEKFLFLVYRTRQAQEVYWSACRQELDKEILNDRLKVALKLERELDQRIVDGRFYLQGHPKSQPDEMAYSFFLVVEAWREKSKQYFSYKKKKDADPNVVKQMRKEIDDYQTNIDNYVNKNIGI